ncbi:hypothetical protein BO71DRAFT_434898 [Aspergillus ellipticus CBS 707.79]|uniref:Uncharacterized protein n=1 Tax=Aspergillus ellipticus CBS 707.79 TaxID=1448320 RepID=A0A319EE30_9EURO|nr:hypothetical protein BO71DRAFT_434898 [Aspergillus ellipticus CBS 707.79]
MLDPATSEKITTAFTSEYKCIFAVSKNDPSSPFMPDATVHNAYYSHHSSVAASGVPGLVFWFLFVKTPLTTTPKCPRFTDEDASALIEEYATAAPGPGYTVKDLWETRVTINAGLGGNLAYESIAHFTNALVTLLKDSPSPSQEQITTLFQQFDQAHRPRAKTVLNVSGPITRYEAQDTGFLKFAARHLSPWVSDKWKAKLYASFSKGAPHLNFLPLKVQNSIRTPQGSAAYSSPRILITGAVVATGLGILWHRLR